MSLAIFGRLYVVYGLSDSSSCCSLLLGGVMLSALSVISYAYLVVVLYASRRAYSARPWV